MPIQPQPQPHPSPLPFPPPHLNAPNILVVTDGASGTRTSLGPGDPTIIDSPDADAYFGLSECIASLKRSFPPIGVTLAHRDTDPNPHFQPNYEHFRFTQIDLEQFNQIWLFGMARDRFTTGAPLTWDIAADELWALTQFMQNGGGVFASGDHEDLGAMLCGSIPRIRAMRGWWFINTDPINNYGFDYIKGTLVQPYAHPNQYSLPCAPPGLGTWRNDTLVPGSDGLFFFDDQSDDIPQTLFPKPHPLLDIGNNRRLNVLPDHMHEGVVLNPAALFLKCSDRS